jgi:hypothetical protein
MLPTVAQHTRECVVSRRNRDDSSENEAPKVNCASTQMYSVVAEPSLFRDEPTSHRPTRRYVDYGAQYVFSCRAPARHHAGDRRRPNTDDAWALRVADLGRLG